jgi:hypothetical protein
MFDLFGASVATPLAEVQLIPAPEPTARELAVWERELLGVSLSSNVLDPMYAPDGAILSREHLEAIDEGQKVMLVGIVTGVRLQTDRQQRRIAFVALEIFDGSTVDVAVWNRTYEETRTLWVEGTLIQMKGPLRFRNDERSVHCDEAIVYDLPSELETAVAGLPVTGPKIEEWTQPPTNEVRLAPTAARTLRPSVSTSDYGNGQIASVTDTSTVPSPETSRMPTAGPGDRRKLLINMTETNRPEEDQMLLREVLQTLLDYPGTDAVDLLITSEGRNWRLEMPIITTGFCTALESRLQELLGRTDVVSIADITPVAVP